jgi:hypothetical protein
MVAIRHRMAEAFQRRSRMAVARAEGPPPDEQGARHGEEQVRHGPSRPEGKDEDEDDPQNEGDDGAEQRQWHASPGCCALTVTERGPIFEIESGVEEQRY